AGDELDIFAAERVALARREVPEGHSERAADFGFEMMHGAGEAVGWKPFRQRVRLEERAIELFRAGRQNPVQSDRTRHGSSAPLYAFHARRTKEGRPVRHRVSNFLKARYRRDRECRPRWRGRA